MTSICSVSAVRPTSAAAASTVPLADSVCSAMASTSSIAAAAMLVARVSVWTLALISSVAVACCFTATAIAVATVATSPMAAPPSRTAVTACPVDERIATIWATISSVARAV